MLFSWQDIDSMLMTKLNSKPPKDLTGNLPADQLHQMFPTPPSHEHPNIASPAEMADSDLHYGALAQVRLVALDSLQFLVGSIPSFYLSIVVMAVAESTYRTKNHISPLRRRNYIFSRSRDTLIFIPFAFILPI
jgi:hypothetical protein